jgi:hypothetical protein
MPSFFVLMTVSQQSVLCINLIKIDIQALPVKKNNKMLKSKLPTVDGRKRYTYLYTGIPESLDFATILKTDYCKVLILKIL